MPLQHLVLLKELGVQIRVHTILSEKQVAGNLITVAHWIVPTHSQNQTRPYQQYRHLVRIQSQLIGPHPSHDILQAVVRGFHCPLGLQ